MRQALSRVQRLRPENPNSDTEFGHVYGLLLAGTTGKASVQSGVCWRQVQSSGVVPVGCPEEMKLFLVVEGRCTAQARTQPLQFTCQR